MWLENPHLTFNRTTLELKLYNQVVSFALTSTFNRTTLELKLYNGFDFEAKCKRLLIVPLWN